MCKTIEHFLTENRKSNAEIHDLLARRDSRNLLDRVSNDASSLRSAEDTRIRKSIADGLTPSLNSTFDEIEFAFDFELINTATYRKAFQCVSRQNLAQVETSADVVVRKSPTPISTMTPPVEEDLLLDMSTDGDGKIEEIVTEGAKQLSNPVPQVLASYGHFTAPPNATQIVTSKPHPFQIAEFVSPAPSSEISPTSEPSESSATFNPEDSMADVHRALEDMMLSQFEDIMPMFLFDAGKPPSGQALLSDEPSEGRSFTPSLDLSVANTQYDTPRTSCDFEDLESTSLIDISIPETIQVETPTMLTIIQDLMELQPEQSSANTLDELEVQEPSLELPGDPDLLGDIFGPSSWALIPETKPNLQSFLDYLAQMRQPILPSTNDTRMDSTVETRIQRVLVISPHSETEALFNGESQSLVSTTTPRELSSLAKYSLETMVHSTAYSKVVKGRKTGLDGDVVGLDVAFRTDTMLIRDSLPLRS